MSVLPPLLYSFRRCPYAIRARMALSVAGVDIRIREVKLSDKPRQLLDVSPKGTVPVLVLADGTVIDESLDIMHWSMAQAVLTHDWLPEKKRKAIDALIVKNDLEFKPRLDGYKYPQSSDKGDPLYYRQQGEHFLRTLETMLSNHNFLLADSVTLADLAIFPFIRQFRGVDENWFEQSQYTLLKGWLKGLLNSPSFLAVMTKYSPWKTTGKEYRIPPTTDISPHQ